MKSIANNQLTFHNTTFNAVQDKGQVWLTSTELGAALQYSDDKAVQRIYSRRCDEFTEQMTRVVKVTTPRGQQETRVFSLRGAHLIAMFSRTTIAKEFRKWVLDILDREVEEHKSESPLLRHYDCRVLYTFDGNGTIVSAQQAREDEHLASAKAFAEVMSKRGYVLVKTEDFKSITFHH
ncbi:BRO-N domain-containing protein [Yersinia pseudotuberculosis]|uniref:BRO-N domain-containing protein n=1 Tax=Yersinia pseudotuberculosis TaxID=633 RepID=UPI0005E99E93|nr:Bro-N domain-containing protein [Yersinia pseudotuberculosis]CND37867.1 BRO family%2C N-terminal domain [Yersinia pseudotuberculosis]CQH06604.1 BRO family%2C N-terminal domain [Yersinia pseudotuberculosis]